MAINSAQMRRLTAQLDPPIRQAFEEAVRNAKGRVNVGALERAIARGDMEAILLAVGYRDGMWGIVTEAVRGAYVEAGIVVMAADVPRRFNMQFNINNPRAQAWLAQESSRYVTEMRTEQIKAIREILEASFAAGRNPRATALDIAGRLNPVTRRRQGGVVGLTGRQGAYAGNARRQLLELDAAYFSRELRDRRYDKAIRKAIREEKALPARFVDRAVNAYEDRLLRHRGENVARTETLAALNAAADETLFQIVDEGIVPEAAIQRVWKHSFAGNDRVGHRALSGQARPLGEGWINPETGAFLLRPGAGAASEVINCRCTVEHRIDFSQVD